MTRLRNRGKMALLLLLMAGAGCGRMWPGRFGQSASVQQLPASTLSVRVGEFVAGTGEQASVVVSLVDEQGQPMVGVTPVLGVSGSQNTVNCSSSNASGSSTCAISSAVAEAKTVTLVDPPLPGVSVVVTALSSNAFRYVWNANGMVTLPLVTGKTYNFTVYWGDGTSAQITSAIDSDRTHTYAAPGQKTITLAGSFDHFQFATNPDELMDVTRWGNTVWGSMNGMFKNATSLVNFSATDVPNTGSVTDFSETFMGATSFNGDVTQWNTASALTMRSMFKGAVTFNQGITSGGGGVWDVSTVTDFSEMFSADISDFTVLNTPAYTPMAFNQDISNWVTSSAVNFSKMFSGCESFNFGAAPMWQTQNVTNMSFMFMHAKVFNSTLPWDVSNVTTFEGMFQGATVFNEDIQAWDTGSATTFKRMFANASVFNQDIRNWNTSLVQSLYETFYGATQFDQLIGNWNTSSNRSLYRTFAGATAFTRNLTTWDTSQVTDMHGTFMNATAFNNGGSPLDWDTPLVTRTSNMFTGATAYNQPMDAVGSVWNFANVTRMEEMFQNATAFNQDLDTWDTSAVQEMTGMFDGATAFNGRLMAWDVSRVTSMKRMFLNAVNFNVGESCGVPDLGKTLSWNSSMVTTMDRMFEGASCFNQQPAFVTTAVTSMAGMFKDAAEFDQSILLWDVSSVTDMTEMFEGAVKFDQQIDTWDVSNVRTFSRMFYSATSFNGAGAPLLWNPIVATDMVYMFFNATAFDQDISTWNVSSVTDARAFHGGSNAVGWVQAERPVFGLGVGSRRMFLTAATFNGDLGGVTGADALCMADANRPPTGSYRALLVVLGQRSIQLPGGAVDWPLQVSMQYTRPDGTLVATTTPGAVFPPTPFNQAISLIGGPFWTGMDVAYSKVENCLDWTASGPGEGGTSSGLSALTSDSVACNQSRRLLCVE